MKQRIEKASKVALTLGFVQTIWLCSVIIYYNCKGWINVSIGAMITVAMQTSGITALLLLVIAIMLNVPIPNATTKVQPTEATKSVFLFMLGGGYTFTVIACEKGFLNVSFFTTIGAILLLDIIYVSIIWLIENAFQSKEEDRKR